MPVYLDDAPFSIEALVLSHAMNLIRAPESWIRGRLCSVRDDGEACYCALGALHHVANYHVGFTGQAYNALLKAALVRGYTAISIMNDDPATTHADIIDLFQGAIEISRNNGNSSSPC